MAPLIAVRLQTPAKRIRGLSPRNAGDRIAIHIGEVIDNNDFRPWIRLIARTAP
jgi:hypothetical protein